MTLNPFLFELYLMELKLILEYVWSLNRILWIVPNGIETFNVPASMLQILLFELYLMELKLAGGYALGRTISALNCT